MSRPIIGITGSHSKNKHGIPQVHLLRSYVAATLKAGGVPVIIPPELDEENRMLIYEKLDGVLFSGGGDMNPKTFNGETHPTVDGVDDDRDALEISLILHTVEDKKPFLAICRGFQVLNVALGGTLYTHLSDQFSNQIQHDTSKESPRGLPVHEVKVEEDSHLAKIVGTPILNVNSWHHQGVKDIPSQLQITAHTPDGLVEAMELEDHPFSIAVQWHPEWMVDDEAMNILFKAFVKASTK